MMQWLELKIPPLVLAVITLLLIWLTAQCLPVSDLPLGLRLSILISATLIGAYFALMGVMSFRHAQTTVLPHCPERASTLVITGVYRYTRNPMYLGFVICLFGVAVFLGSFFSLIWVVGLMLYLTYFQIKPEENALQKQFPDDFSAYQAKVRRWL